MIVGSILALMAFLLAIAMGMAADRFDTRRGLVLQELTGRRSTITAVMLAVVLSAVVALVVDLDRPAEGVIRTSQQPLIDLRDSLDGR
jgi:MFS family permease